MNRFCSRDHHYFNPDHEVPPGPSPLPSECPSCGLTIRLDSLGKVIAREDGDERV